MRAVSEDEWRRGTGCLIALMFLGMCAVVGSFALGYASGQRPPEHREPCR